MRFVILLLLLGSCADYPNAITKNKEIYTSNMNVLETDNQGRKSCYSNTRVHWGVYRDTIAPNYNKKTIILFSVIDQSWQHSQEGLSAGQHLRDMKRSLPSVMHLIAQDPIDEKYLVTIAPSPIDLLITISNLKGYPSYALCIGCEQICH